MSAKPFDIIVHGATGYTGRLVTRALLNDADSAIGAPNALKWAIAGRNEKKLLETKDKLKAFPDVDAAAIDAVPIVVADSMDEAKIVEMVQQTKVVLSLVGPYKLYGELLVKACAEHGVHYCDLTGETYFIREMVDKYDAVAQQTGAKIVNCCGFDSIPSDMTTYLLTETIRQNRHLTTSQVKFLLTDFQGGIGGGTIASGLVMMDKATPAEMQAMNDPFHLTDDATMADKEKRGLTARNADAMSLRVTKEPEINAYSGQFFMTACNQAIVHRSNYLLNDQYGQDFVYRERKARGSWFSLWMGSISMAIGTSLFACGPVRRLIAKLVTQPGDGPSEEVLHSGSVQVHGFAYDANNELAAKLVLTGAADPGYFLTSKMIAECAKCLATDETSERGNKGGLLTPASAFGQCLVDRLERKNIFKFEVEAM